MRDASRVAEQLKAQDLRKLGNIRKVSKPHRMIAQCPAPPPKFVNTSEKLLKNRNKTFPVLSTPHESLSPCFNLKLELLTCKKVLKYALLCNRQLETWY